LTKYAYPTLGWQASGLSLLKAEVITFYSG